MQTTILHSLHVPFAVYASQGRSLHWSAALSVRTLIDINSSLRKLAHAIYRDLLSCKN